MVQTRGPVARSPVAGSTRKRDAVRLTPEDIEGMRKVGRLASSILDVVAEMIRPGTTTEAIDKRVDEMTRAAGATSGPFRYTGGGNTPFPKHCCTSVNEVVCHGIPTPKRTLREGDIVNVDVTPVLAGYYGDTSRTFLVGTVSPEARRLVETTEAALKLGIAVVKPGATVGDIGHAIQTFVEGRGYSVVRQFAGHGVGKIFHGPPTIAHYGKKGHGLAFEPGMSFTIEPMVNVGDWRCVMLDDGWTAVTADGTLSAQFEHTLVVTETGVEVFTGGASRVGMP